jgi:hypothetical protein
MEALINVSKASETSTPFTKATAANLVQSILHAVSDGKMHTGEALALCRLLKDVAEDVEKDLKRNAQDWSGRGASVKLSSGCTYDYSNTPAHVALTITVKQIEEEAKRLQKVGQPRGIVADADGVVHEVFPATPKYNQRITVTLDKA